VRPQLTLSVALTLCGAFLLPAVWATHAVDDEFRIAIIDSGINANHAEFASCGDGFTITWKDYVSNGPSPYDDIGHGTAVASVAVGKTLGESPCTSLLVARVCEYDEVLETGTCQSSLTSQAIQWAVNNGADVINLSLGSLLPTPEPMSAYEGAISYARGQQVLVVVAAGNGAANLGLVPTPSEVDQPSGHEHALVVGASRAERTAYIGTSSDPELIQHGIGVPVARHTTNTGTTSMTGTSFSAPNVAGIAVEVQKAWLAQHGSRLSVSEWENFLKWTAVDSGASAAFEGYGYLDRTASLAQVPSGMPIAPCDRPIILLDAEWANECANQLYVETATNTVRQFW